MFTKFKEQLLSLIDLDSRQVHTIQTQLLISLHLLSQESESETHVDSDAIEAHLLLALCYLKKNQITETKIALLQIRILMAQQDNAATQNNIALFDEVLARLLKVKNDISECQLWSNPVDISQMTKQIVEYTKDLSTNQSISEQLSYLMVTCLDNELAEKLGHRIIALADPDSVWWLAAARSNVVYSYVAQNKLVEAESMLEQALQYAKSLKAHRSLSEGFLGLGQSIFSLSKQSYSLVDKCYQQALALAEPNDKLNISNILINMAASYFAQDKLPEAESITEQILQYTKNLRSEQSISENLNRLACVLYNKRLYSSAEKFYQQAIEVADMSSKPALVRMQVNLAFCYASQGKLHEKKSAAEKALQYAENLKNHPSLIDQFSGLASNFYQCQEYSYVEKLYSTAIVLADPNNGEKLTELRKNIVKCYLAQGKYQESIDLILKDNIGSETRKILGELILNHVKGSISSIEKVQKDIIKQLLLLLFFIDTSETKLTMEKKQEEEKETAQLRQEIKQSLITVAASLDGEILKHHFSEELAYDYVCQAMRTLEPALKSIPDKLLYSAVIALMDEEKITAEKEVFNDLLHKILEAFNQTSLFEPIIVFFDTQKLEYMIKKYLLKVQEEHPLSIQDFSLLKNFILTDIYQIQENVKLTGEKVRLTEKFIQKLINKAIAAYHQSQQKQKLHLALSALSERAIGAFLAKNKLNYLQFDRSHFKKLKILIVSCLQQRLKEFDFTAELEKQFQQYDSALNQLIIEKISQTNGNTITSLNKENISQAIGQAITTILTELNNVGFSIMPSTSLCLTRLCQG